MTNSKKKKEEKGFVQFWAEPLHSLSGSLRLSSTFYTLHFLLSLHYANFHHLTTTIIVIKICYGEVYCDSFRLPDVSFCFCYSFYFSWYILLFFAGRFFMGLD
jgi:hypothetical protein